MGTRTPRAPIRFPQLPRTLRQQFLLFSLALALLIVTGGVVGVYALRESAAAIRQLSERRLARMQDAQEIVRRTFLVERAMHQILDAGTHESITGSYGEVIAQLENVDRLVTRLGMASDDTAVLALHQSGQLFRNTAHVVTRLKEDVIRANLAFTQALEKRTVLLQEIGSPGARALAIILYRLRDPAGRSEIAALRDQFSRQAAHVQNLPPIVSGDLQAMRAGASFAGARRLASIFSQRLQLFEQQEILRRYHGELHRQAQVMAASAQDLSGRLTAEYREAIRQLADSSERSQRWVLALLAASLILAWLVYRHLLGQNVLARLQQVSRYLRQGGTGSGQPEIPVHGSDEISEMARAAERFMRDRLQLAETNKELEDFSYAVSHDLHPPLRAIDGYRGLLEKRMAGSLDEQSRRYLESISRAVGRMSALIDGLLTFTQLGRFEMVKRPVDVGALVRDVITELAPSAAGRDVRWKVAELPTVSGDRATLRLVFVNLISNALKFTRARHPAEIEIGQEPGMEGETTLFVRDNGVGFDMQYADKLFGVFQRLHGADEFEGTGIGLANVRRIVVRHGGRTWAEGKVDGGATFYLSLPVSPSLQPGDRPASPAVKE
jgi:signal transduction histidine kinase